MRKLILLLGLACLVGLPPTATAASKTEVRLLLDKSAAAPGESLFAAVHLKTPPGWHTYWRNAGDSGEATKIEWKLPPGVTAGAIQWPTPEKLTEAGYTTYIYKDEVLLLVPLQLAKDVPPGNLELKASVSWLECDKSCVPGKGSVQAVLTIGPQSKPSAEAPLLDIWRKRIPAPASAAIMARALWESPAHENTRALLLEWNTQDAKQADFFPYAAENYALKGETDSLNSGRNKVRLRKVMEKQEGAWPSEIVGLLVERGAATEVQEAKVTIEAAAQTAAGGPASSLWAMLGFAFLGGLILNIMPCVLPVIALKILGFVSQSQESPRRVALLGTVYAGGVLLSFLILAGVIVGLKQAGHAASWGMQFQNARFLAAMTILVTLVALNLFGLFEFNLSGTVMGAAGDLAAKEGVAGAFFNGILATALATPCTAPFLAPALGFAFAQPARVIVLMFLTIGLGLAFPYLVLSFRPAWLKFLPKPGAWMQKFKVAMGFPMLGTALWMLTLTAPHFGNGGVLWFGIFLVGLALAVWIWGEFVQRGRSRRGLAIAVSLAVLVGFAGLVLGRSSEKIEWQPWTAAAIEKARAEGRPVFVDFTADWCLTCQANKRSSIEISAVRAKLKAVNAVTLLGDYTRQDDAITMELKRFSRAGVPLVLVYPKTPGQAPIVLPELLTPTIVLDALDKAGAATGTLKAPSAGLTSTEK